MNPEPQQRSLTASSLGTIGSAAADRPTDRLPRWVPPQSWWTLSERVEDYGDRLPCRRYPSSLWFPEKGVHPEQMEHVRSLCNSCPILRECREYGIDAGRQELGIWGGLGNQERYAKAEARKSAAREGS